MRSEIELKMSLLGVCDTKVEEYNPCVCLQGRKTSCSVKFSWFLNDKHDTSVVFGGLFLVLV